MAMPPQTPPSTLALIIGASIAAGVAGFFLGQASSLGIFGGSSSTSRSSGHKQSTKKKKNSRNPRSAGAGGSSSDVSDGSDASDESEDQGDLKEFEKEGKECKMTLVVRTDLGMTKGKIAAQCSHATLANYKALSRTSAGQSLLRRWEQYGQAKVALQVKTEEELEVLQAQAVSLGVCANIIHDAGHTQIASGSATVLGVGPAPKGVVDGVTGGLKLL